MAVCRIRQEAETSDIGLKKTKCNCLYLKISWFVENLMIRKTPWDYDVDQTAHVHAASKSQQHMTSNLRIVNTTYCSTEHVKHLEINLAKNTKELCSGTYKTVPKEISENLNEWRDTPCPQTTRRRSSLGSEEHQSNPSLQVARTPKAPFERPQSWETNLGGLASAEPSAHRSMQVQSRCEGNSGRKEGPFNILEQLKATCQEMNLDPHSTQYTKVVVQPDSKPKIIAENGILKEDFLGMTAKSMTLVSSS